MFTFAFHVGSATPCERATSSHDCPRSHEYRRSDRPMVLSVTHVGTMADRAIYRALVSYGDHGGQITTWFQGSADPGYPGPVIFRTEAFAPDAWERVVSPQRFGDTFNAAWVRAFYS